MEEENKQFDQEAQDQAPATDVAEESAEDAFAPEQETPAPQVEEVPQGKKGKKVLTPEQKRKKRIRGGIITAVVFGAIGLIVAILAIANAVSAKGLYEQALAIEPVNYTHTQLVPTLDSDGYYTFTTDGDFEILQVTDVHIGGGCFSAQKDVWAMNAVATMARQKQPDLIVVTGDIAYPVPFSSGTFNNLSALRVFAVEMESLKVYWTFAFGNHDTEAYSFYTRKEISDWLQNQHFTYCLYSSNNTFTDKEEAEDFGYGNNLVKVKNSAGIVTQAIVTFDSHSYTDGDFMGALWKYDNIHQSQIDWYSTEMGKLRAANAAKGVDEPVKNMAFFHIPLREYRNAWKEYELNGYADTANVQKIYGVNGEEVGASINPLADDAEATYGVYCGVYKEELIDKLWNAGIENGLQATFCGHDHINNFSVNYTHNGYTIRLTYGMSIDYLAYSGIFQKHSQRGCTDIVVKPDGSFECKPLNYYADFGVQPEAGTLDDINE